MAGSVFDSPLLHKLFAAGDASRLFTDAAEVRAMLLVQGTLAKVQGAAGIIPADSAAFIHRSSLEVQIDPAGLADATSQNGVSIPALVTAFRKAMEAPDHAQYLHWGATSQDIIDTGLMLRLRQLLTIVENDAREVIASLGKLANDHAQTVMIARTYGQYATPTTFGAVAAGWGHPLADLVDQLADLREKSLLVSLSGAAGTASELGDDPAALRAAMATELRLSDPQRSWHADRSPILNIMGWLLRLSTAIGKIGEDLLIMTQSGVAEARLGASGASSTMPQKQNPVGPSVMVALARHVVGLHGTLAAAAMPRQQRDGAAWFTEWLTVPQLCLSAAAALTAAKAQIAGLSPNSDAMQSAIDSSGGMMLAEAISFALTDRMPRPEAQAAVKDLCKTAITDGRPLDVLARETWPDLPAALFDAVAQTGTAPNDALSFAQRAKNYVTAE